MTNPCGHWLVRHHPDLFYQCVVCGAVISSPHGDAFILRDDAFEEIHYGKRS